MGEIINVTIRERWYMDNKSKTLTVVAVILAAITIAMAVALANVSQANEKLEAILDVACKYSGNDMQCHAGLNMLKNMDIKDIKKWGK